MDSTEQFAAVYGTLSGEGIVAWNTRYRSTDGLINRLTVSPLTKGATTWLSSPEDRPFDTVIVLPGPSGYIALWPDSAGGTRIMRAQLLDSAGSMVSEPITLGPYRSVGFAGTIPAPDLPGFVVVWSTDVDSTAISYFRSIGDDGQVGPLSEYAGRVTSVNRVTSYLGDNRLVQVTLRLHLKIAPDGSIEPVRSIRNIPAHATYGSDGEVLYVERDTLYSLASLTDSFPRNRWRIPSELSSLPIAGRYKGAPFVLVDSTWTDTIDPLDERYNPGLDFRTKLVRYFPEGAPDDSAELSFYDGLFSIPPHLPHVNFTWRASWRYSSEPGCNGHHLVRIAKIEAGTTYRAGQLYPDSAVYHYEYWLTSSGRKTSRPGCDVRYGSVAYVSDSATASVEVYLGRETLRPDGVPIAPLVYPQPGNTAGLTLIGDEVVAVWHDLTHQVNRVHYLDAMMKEHYLDSTQEGDGLRSSGTAVTYRIMPPWVAGRSDTVKFMIPSVLGLRQVEFPFDWTPRAAKRIVRGAMHPKSGKLLVLVEGSAPHPPGAVVIDPIYGTAYLQEMTERTIENTWLLGWSDSLLRVGDGEKILTIDPLGTVVETGRVPVAQHEIVYWAELETGRSIRIQRLPDSLWRIEQLNYDDPTDYASIDLNITELPIVRAVGSDGAVALLWGSDSGVRLSLLDRSLRPIDDSLDPASGGVRISASSSPARLPYAIIDEQDLVIMWTSAESDSQVFIRRVALQVTSQVPEAPSSPIENDREGDRSVPRYEISVRPNPPSRGGPVSLEIAAAAGSFQQGRPITVEVFNGVGQRIWYTRIDDLRERAEPILLITTGWPSGRYFLKVSDGKTSEEIPILYYAE